MRATALQIPGVILIEPRRLADARGRFAETYNLRAFAEQGIDATFVQDNEAVSAAPGVVRGLHFQAPPAAQAKLIRVVAGSIFDVVVDIRRGSPSFGQHIAVTLTAEAGEQLFVPAGLAHGYCALVADTHVLYKVDEFYAPAQEGGLAWNDPDLGIAWPAAVGDFSLNDRDRSWPRLKDFETPFVWSPAP